ncbi:SusC/RagA family TonB-linked outer membrane protein [Pararhodonellum marinum]|uniref:SusC/RagA family TonB-linked outer membrane protein n=1 Tax=Pararhodonellum marinum TaxID=2755358 RepID=UPI001E52CFD4|nr:TonB-dependent receptor [Pararhodonellum marinum]
MMKNLSKTLKPALSLVFSLCLLLSGQTLYAQAGSISGTVTEQNGEPIIGVTVQLRGTGVGTVTDLEGRYTLEVSGSDPVLVFRSMGFKTQEVPLENWSILNVTMESDLASLDEVVVIGYGSQKRSDLTGSVSSVKAEQLTAFPAINVVQALQGRAAGVQIQANNGEPGASFKVRIRGGTSINASSDPIFVVDGFIGAAMPPPEDIQSVEVLKDASATAIYGSRGANGVIMVTTKRGKKGAPRIELNTAFSSQEEISRLDLLNANEFMDYITEIRPQFSSLGANTDWQDEIFRTGHIQNHQLSISGGADNVDYYVSSAFFDQKGVIIGSGFNRFSITSNVNIQASDRLKLGLNIFAQRSSQEGTRTQEGSGGSNNTGVVAGAFKFEPDQPIFDENGRYTIARMNDPHDNPVAVAREYQNESVNDRVQGNFFAEYQITENLSFKTTLGATTNSGRIGTYTPTTLNAGRNVGGQGNVNGSRSTLLLNENYLSFSKTYAEKHNLSVMGGYSYQSQTNENWGGAGQNFVTDAFEFWNLGAASVWLRPSSSLQDWTLASFYGRVNYGFDDRFLVQLNARYDGSSTFSVNNKWAFFPSGAVAWNLGNEAFLKDNQTISLLKLRTSYGLTGNQAIAPFQTLARFSDVFTIVNGLPVNAIRPTTVANNDLTWETTAQFNIGTDIAILSDRIYATFEYYRMVTSDLLFEVPLPQYSGFSNQLQNVGKVENKGVELTLGARILTGAFQWNTDVNFSRNRNKVLSLPGGNDILYGSGPGHMVGLGQTQILREGFPVGSFFGWIYEGVYQEGDTFIPGGGFEQVAGGEKFADLNGDGVLNANDREIIGNPHPDFIFGWNNDFRWKNFDLNIFFQGSQGNDILSYTLMELNLLSGINNATTDALNRWTPQNTDTDVPRASIGRTRRVSTRFIYDGSFVRLKNLALGYNLPFNMTRKIGVQRLRIYASAQNILTFTNYEGYDPEVNYNSGGAANGNRNLGLDYGSYPNAKSYTLGLNIGF